MGLRNLGAGQGYLALVLQAEILVGFRHLIVSFTHNTPPVLQETATTPDPPYLDVLGALGRIEGVQDLQATHVAHVAVQISTVEAVAALAHCGIRAQLLLQLLLSALFLVFLLDEEAGRLRQRRVGR